MKKSLLVFVTATLLLLTSCQPKQYHKHESVIFGTVYHVTYASTENLQNGIEENLAKFDLSLSTFNPKSTLSSFNQSGTKPFDLSADPWMLKVVKESIHFSELSQGAFDITVGPLVNLWGFGTKERSNPSQKEVDSIRAFVGYQKLKLDGSKLSKSDPRIQLDCSAIAKGYACDVIAEYLRSQGVTDFLVEIGGEMTLGGRNPEGKPWNIGINKPVDDSTSTNMDWGYKLKITDKGIATSGNYRNFYIKDGKKYAHTINPKTGKPIVQSLLSATIVAKDCLSADALATACMVMGTDSALALIERLPDAECLLLSLDEKGDQITSMSSGMKQFLSE